MQSDLTKIHEEVGAALEKLSKLFTPDCKLTFFMRKPNYPDCHLLISDDSNEEILKSLTYIVSKDE